MDSKIDYINKTIPLIVESFNELKIKQVITIEGEKFTLKNNGSVKCFIVTNLYNDDRYVIGHTINDAFLSKDFTYTETLKSKVEKLLTEKANKISELKFKLL